ncbi:hypothetical protein K439DRAFT_1567606 [Ramaria rubella]|nr:hypothetical protein K439DRAFT_1567606 [Ramaria rubella]
MSFSIAPMLSTSQSLHSYEINNTMAVSLTFNTSVIRNNVPVGFSECFIHSKIYKKCPDVVSVVHAHTYHLAFPTSHELHRSTLQDLLALLAPQSSTQPHSHYRSFPTTNHTTSLRGTLYSAIPLPCQPIHNELEDRLYAQTQDGHAVGNEHTGCRAEGGVHKCRMQWRSCRRRCWGYMSHH